MNHLERLWSRYPDLRVLEKEIIKGYEIMEEAYSRGGKLLVCGNGGSAADSDHIVGELMKGFYKQRRLPKDERAKYGELGEFLQGTLTAIALTQHSALSTAFLNDVEPSMVFAQQVMGYGRPGDVLLAISTSGSSDNVVKAARIARARGLQVIGLTGRDGGQLRELGDVCVTVPLQITADIQEHHLPIYHTWCAMLEEHFFPEG